MKKLSAILLLLLLSVAAGDAANVRFTHGALPEGVVRYVRPEYPRLARANYYVGQGLYRLQIDPKSGKVSSVTVLKSTTHKILDDAVIAAFSQWQFRPGSAKTATLPVTFTRLGRKLNEARRLAIYAPEAEPLATGPTGVGTYRFIVDYDTGNVKDVQVIKSSGRKSFDEAVVKSYRRWRFLPHKVRSIDTTTAFGP